jgi:hypothetical protein
MTDPLADIAARASEVAGAKDALSAARSARNAAIVRAAETHSLRAIATAADLDVAAVQRIVSPAPATDVARMLATVRKRDKRSTR